ncbi:MAG: helix-turn-helix transcriptional regulator [Caldilineaceae bacterium]
MTLHYTFADLLNIFFRLQQDEAQRKTQDDLARELGVGRRTVAGWFAGDYLPRSAEQVEKLARTLCLTAFQADLLLYAANPAWIKYGTPPAVLAAAEVVRYREEDVAQSQQQAVPALAQIEQAWALVVNDPFEHNYRRWGVGIKETGICRVERRLADQRYTLTLQNQYHEDVFMGGDGSCLAPPIYYLTVMARLVQGDTEDDGYGLMFEAISDECYALLRVREKRRRISVTQTFNGGDNAMVYLRQVPAPSLRGGEGNKLAILAIHQDHWFYVNDALVGQCVIPRLAVAKLDVGIIAGYQQTVVCAFQHFRVYVPSAKSAYPLLETLMQTPVA